MIHEFEETSHFSTVLNDTILAVIECQIKIMLLCTLINYEIKLKWTRMIIDSVNDKHEH